MTDSNRILDRVGAVAGVATVALFVATIAATPSVPSPNHGLATITRSLDNDLAGYERATFLGALLAGSLVLFGAVVAARVRRRDPDGGWSLIALAGVAATSVGLTTDMMVLTLTRAVDHGVRGPALWVGYPAGPDGFMMAVPLALFFLGAGMGSLVSGALPRWLAWAALVIAAMFVVGTASVLGDEVDGGALGAPLIFGWLAFLLWTLAASISIWRVSAP